MLKKNPIKLTTIQFISLGFAMIILVGTGLLMLPISSISGNATGFLPALFTATSATCVTGLVVYDTATYWSLFGQLVILVLIQVGGLGFMTITISALAAAGKRIGLKQRLAMQEAISGSQVGGIVSMGKFIMLFVLLVELIGAILLSVRFIPMFGVTDGIFYAIFHSISAFCNAGFDLMGVIEPFSSLTYFATDIYMNTVIMLLIIFGGLGFFVWHDILTLRGKLKKFTLHSKIVITTTIALLIFGTLGFWLLEWNKDFMGDNVVYAFISALFQSVSSRTAGFNTVDLTGFSDISILLFSVLMLIGGSPGSTAGGMKTTTVAVLFLSMVAEFRSKKSLECFGRRLSEGILRQACAIGMFYIIIAITGAIAISLMENIALNTALFETCSAVGTVGLSLGITPNLSPASQAILAVLMYVGRVGGFTCLLIFAHRGNFTNSQLPQEKVNLG